TPIFFIPPSVSNRHAAYTPETPPPTMATSSASSDIACSSQNGFLRPIGRMCIAFSEDHLVRRRGEWVNWVRSDPAARERNLRRRNCQRLPALHVAQPVRLRARILIHSNLVARSNSHSSNLVSRSITIYSNLV